MKIPHVKDSKADHILKCGHVLYMWKLEKWCR